MKNMKKIILFAALVLIATNLIAQTPNKFSYQAVIRNSDNTLVDNSPVGIQITILQGTTPVYVETQTVNSNLNGLISLEIGGGTVVSGTFSNINWSSGTYSIKTEIDPDGGTNYTINGTSQMLSVPFAMYSNNGLTAAEKTKLTNLSGTNTGDQDLSGLATTTALTTAVNTVNTSLSNKVDKVTGKNLSTEDYTTAEKTKLSGIAAGAEVNVNPDWNATSGDAMILNKPTIPAAANGSETKLTAGTNVTITGSGTTASPYVINSTASGSGSRYLGENYLGGIVFYIYKGSDGQEHGLIVSTTEAAKPWSGASTVNADRLEDGAYNTLRMPNTAGSAREYVETLGSGWYIPSIDELMILFNNRYHVNKAIRSSGTGTILGLLNYWSSYEGGGGGAGTAAYFIQFNIGVINTSAKTGPYTVRGVKAF